MEPEIHFEEKIGKRVGRRVLPQDRAAFGMALQNAGVGIAREFRLRGLPKGVYRFRSHEEANAWLMRQRTRQAKD